MPFNQFTHLYKVITIDWKILALSFAICMNKIRSVKHGRSLKKKEFNSKIVFKKWMNQKLDISFLNRNILGQRSLSNNWFRLKCNIMCYIYMCVYAQFTFCPKIYILKVNIETAIKCLNNTVHLFFHKAS